MRAPGLVDTHAHLIDRAFDDDRAAVLSRAQAAGVSHMLIVGYDLATSRAAVELARAIPWARASVGIHPNAAGAASEPDYAEINELARQPEVIAIGETGLDYYRDRTPPERQRHSLEWHLLLAEDLNLPVIIHNREADTDVATMLEATASRQRPGVLHCFSSTDARYLERMLAAGYITSFAGTLTYKNAADLRASAASVPLDRLLVETDCPYLAPQRHRGQRNEPAFIVETARCLAELQRVPFDALVDQLWRNSTRVFPALAGAMEQVA